MKVPPLVAFSRRVRRDSAMFVIPKLLNTEQIAEITEALKDAVWQDGKLTTSDDLKNIKSNKQVLEKTVIAKVERALFASPGFRNSVLLKGFCKTMIVKYEKDMHYGTHSDAWIQNGRRADFSFTLFLNDKDDYKGGELIIEELGMEKRIKLDAGSLLLYPSTALHRVNKVTEGIRLVAVGWVTSHIRNEEYRSILHNLSQATAEIYKAQGASMPYTKLTQVYNNLMRLWSD
jgi:PKHD-type hydroxylase